MKTINFVVECSVSESENIENDLKSVADGEIVVAEKSNLDGADTILQIAEIIASVASTLTPIISGYINKKKDKKIKKIKFGDVEIENPTKEQWEKVWEDYLDKNSRDE